MILHRTHSRAGLTLLEVILAMAIFLFSSLAIWQLVGMGGERAMEIRQETRTSSRCQTKLAEVVIGAQAMSSSGYAYFEDEEGKDLQWQLEVEDGPGNGLFLVKVSVKKEFSDGRFVESNLAQLVLDPSIRGSSLDRSNPPVTTTPTTDPSTTTPESGTTTPSTTTPSTTTPSTTTPSTSSPSTTPPTTKTGGGGKGS